MGGNGDDAAKTSLRIPIPQALRNSPQPWWMAIIDKSIAVALLSVVLWLGFRWHTKVMLEVLEYYKDQNHFYRESLEKKLDEVSRKLDNLQHKK